MKESVLKCFRGIIIPPFWSNFITIISIKVDQLSGKARSRSDIREKILIFSHFLLCQSLFLHNGTILPIVLLYILTHLYPWKKRGKGAQWYKLWKSLSPSLLSPLFTHWTSALEEYCIQTIDTSNLSLFLNDVWLLSLTPNPRFATSMVIASTTPDSFFKDKREHFFI